MVLSLVYVQPFHKLSRKYNPSDTFWANILYTDKQINRDKNITSWWMSRELGFKFVLSGIGYQVYLKWSVCLFLWCWIRVFFFIYIYIHCVGNESHGISNQHSKNKCDTHIKKVTYYSCTPLIFSQSLFLVGQ